MQKNKNVLNTKRFAVVFASLLLILSNTLWSSSPLAWDSSVGNPTHPTHSHLTEWTINQLESQYPELQQFRNDINEGANSELHELPVSGTQFGIDLEAKRIQH